MPAVASLCNIILINKTSAKVEHVMKVGRNNFKPSPQVESSVIRIEPRNPPPPINFKEWDGLMRIVFVRKNKTLAANFKTTSVLQIIENNYKTYCSINNMMVDDTLDIKQKVISVLQSVNMGESRASKLDIDDFLKLLYAFNQANIHFC